MKKTNKKAVAQSNGSKSESKAGATKQAVVFELNLKQNHSMRQTAQDKLKVDLFATHAMGRTSSAYIALCAEAAGKVCQEDKSKETTHVLLVGGVGNMIVLRADGFYSRNGGTLCGNVDALSKLYGKSVQVIKKSELEKLWNERKEEVTRRIGGKSGKTVTGRELASEDNRFALMVRQNNGSIAVQNGEWDRNSHNHGVRAAELKTTAVVATK